MNKINVARTELSKKLKEVGYKQEGAFWWVNAERGHCYEGEISWQAETINKGKFTLHNDISQFDEIDFKSEEYNFEKEKILLSEIEHIVAPLASELMERLPIMIKVKQLLGTMTGYLELYKREYKGVSWYGVCYRSIKHETDETLCNALAKMYIYLAENKLFKEE